MMDFDNVESKIVKLIAEKEGIPEARVKEVIDSFYRSCRDLMILPTPVEIRIPFLGTYRPHKSFIKKFKDGQRAKASNTGRE